MVDGTPRLFIDGEPTVPLAYATLGKRNGMNYWNSCLGTVALARDAGVDIYRVGSSAGNLMVDYLRGNPIMIDTSEFDEIIAVNSNALFIVSISLTPHPYYRVNNHMSETNKYPAENDYSGMVWNYNISTSEIEPHDRQSLLSEKTWQDLEPCVEILILELESKYGDRIIMYWPAYGNLGEWYYQLWRANLIPGFGPCTVAGFQQWASNTYGTVSAMNTAWGSSHASFSEVPVPTWTERNSGSAGHFFDPNEAADRYVIDFFDFFNDTMNYGAKRIAAQIKELTGRNKLVGMFWQYLHPLAQTSLNRVGLNHSGHLKLIDLLECPDIDVLGTPSYHHVEHWKMPFHGTVDTIQAHGKLFWHEHDMATHLRLHPEAAANIDETLKTYAYDFQEYIERQCGAWFFDIASYEGEDFSILNDPGIWAYVAGRVDYWKEHILDSDGANFQPEIAVIRNEKSARYMVSRNPILPAVYSSDITNTLTQMIQHLVEVRDAPVGWYMLDDLLAGKVPDSVRIFLFADTFVVDRSDAFALLDRLDERPGCMAVWFYAPGYLDPAHLSSQNAASIWFVNRLTGGIRPQLLAAPLRDWLAPGSHDLAAGVPPFGTARTDFNPQFHIAAGLPGVETLCTYADDPGKIAAAILPAAAGRGWDSVYICSPTINAELLANLAARAGLLPASGFNDEALPGWTVGQGDWVASTGLLRQGATNAPAWIGLESHAASDFSLQADVQLSGSGWAGLGFRKQEPEGSPFESGYLVHVRTDGTVALHKPGGTLASAASGGDPVDGFVRIRVEALGRNLVVHANGNPIIAVEDDGYAQGYAGFATDAGTTARFDRFRIGEVSPDIDADGMPNGWEELYFSSAIGASPGDDPDGDGFTNLEEYIAGTNPLDAESRFEAALENHVLSWSAATGRTYRIWRTFDLDSPFERVGQEMAFPQDTWADPDGAPAAFYRLDVRLVE